MNSRSIRLGASVLTLALALLIFPGASEANTDITLRQLTLRDADHYWLAPAATGKLAVIGNVYNGGSSAVPRGVDVECRVFTPRVKVYGIATGTIPQSVLPRKTGSFTLLLPGTGKPGRFTVQCKLDTKNRLRERNRGNNIARTEVTLRPFNGAAYKLKVTGVSPISSLTSTLHGTVVFTVGGLQTDLVAHDANGKYRPMWAVDCNIPNMPWTKIREQGHMLKLVTGAVPARGKTVSSSAWIDGLRLVPHPSIEKFAPQLPLHCTLTVGVFHYAQHVWRDTRSVKRWSVWEPVQVWWKGTQKLVLNNNLSQWRNKSPSGALSTAKGEVSLRCPGASSSTDRRQISQAKPVASRDIFLHVTVNAKDIRYRYAIVACSVSKGRRKVRVGAKRVRYARGDRHDVIKLGRLSAGVYDYVCMLDAQKQLKDSNRNNNTCRGKVDVGF